MAYKFCILKYKLCKFNQFIFEWKNSNSFLVSKFLSVGKKGEYVLGKELVLFEKEVKKFLKVKHVLGVGNWTEGMIILLKALNYNKNDEIITVSNSSLVNSLNIFSHSTLNLE